MIDTEIHRFYYIVVLGNYCWWTGFSPLGVYSGNSDVQLDKINDYFSQVTGDKDYPFN